MRLTMSLILILSTLPYLEKHIIRFVIFIKNIEFLNMHPVQVLEVAMNIFLKKRYDPLAEQAMQMNFVMYFCNECTRFVFVNGCEYTCLS